MVFLSGRQKQRHLETMTRTQPFASRLGFITYYCTCPSLIQHAHVRWSFTGRNLATCQRSCSHRTHTAILRLSCPHCRCYRKKTAKEKTDPNSHVSLHNYCGVHHVVVVVRFLSIQIQYRLDKNWIWGYSVNKLIDPRYQLVNSIWSTNQLLMTYSSCFVLKVSILSCYFCLHVSGPTFHLCCSLHITHIIVTYNMCNLQRYCDPSR